ncbi:hypothetical protein NPIL_335521 [Nephila pilipes]|uniref:Uncharacterized protein n=1 Tax=Nephila pilipes TaxID=299642 RepID=A0A8X6P489_NEPPI|nr:hypothetical protein NPIL_335521 [Nephila pilipes]
MSRGRIKKNSTEKNSVTRNVPGGLLQNPVKNVLHVWNSYFPRDGQLEGKEWKKRGRVLLDFIDGNKCRGSSFGFDGWKKFHQKHPFQFFRRHH